MRQTILLLFLILSCTAAIAQPNHIQLSGCTDFMNDT
jgi:hypothetical protein